MQFKNSLRIYRQMWGRTDQGLLFSKVPYMYIYECHFLDETENSSNKITLSLMTSLPHSCNSFQITCFTFLCCVSSLKPRLHHNIPFIVCDYKIAPLFSFAPSPPNPTLKKKKKKSNFKCWVELPLCPTCAMSNFQVKEIKFVGGKKMYWKILVIIMEF